MSENIQNWLLSSNEWTKLYTLKNILKISADSEQYQKAVKELLKNINIKKIIDEFEQWDNTVVNSHKSAGQLYHKLVFFSDLGLTKNEKQIENICKKVFKNISDEGVFEVLMNIPKHFGGDGQNHFSWALCDAPLLVYALSKMGYKNDERVIKARDFLLGLNKDFGFPCVVSQKLGKFRGPGKKSDPCPYASMIMLKMISENEELNDSQIAKTTIDVLLNLWKNSENQHPYMFYMGKDFRKLKAPFIWYDIVNFADTLSKFEYARKTSTFKEIKEILIQKADKNGMYTPESEWKAWNEWDFGQKKTVSPFLTALVYNIIER